MIDKSISKMLNTINFVFSIMIIYMHATNIKIYDYSQNIIGEIFYRFQLFMSKDILAVCVPGFFIMSGYLYYNNISKSKLISKIRKRFNTLFVPYFLWNTIALIYFFVLSNVLKNILNMESINLSFGTILNGVLLFEYSPVNWFVFQLLIYVLLSPLLFYIFNNKKITITFITVIGFFVLINFNYGFISTNSFMPCFRIDSFFYYCVGIYISKYQNIFIKLKNISNIKNVILTFVVSQLILYIDTLSSLNLFFIGIIILFFSFAMCLFKISIPKYLQKITPFFIFQIHSFILEPIEKLLYIIFGNNLVMGILDYLFAPVICFLFIYVFTLLIQKNCPKLYNKLVGGRQLR